MALRDIIKGLEDNAEVQIGEQKVRVGDIRGEFYDPEKYVTKETFDKLSADNSQLSNGVLNFLNRAAASTQQDMDRMAGGNGNGTTTPPADPRAMFKDALRSIFDQEQGYDYSKDNYIGPAMSKVEEKAYERALAKAEEIYGPRIKDLDDRLKQTTAQAILAEENAWWNQNHRELPMRPDKQAYSLNDLRQLALANRVLDTRGYPDYNRLKEALLEPSRREKELTEKEEAAYKRGIADARKAAAQQLVDVPGRGFVPAGEAPKPLVETKGKTTDQMFREALNLALNDEDIMNMSQGQFTSLGR